MKSFQYANSETSIIAIAPIAARKELPLDEPPVTHNLFPRDYTVISRGGGEWPK